MFILDAHGSPSPPGKLERMGLEYLPYAKDVRFSGFGGRKAPMGQDYSVVCGWGTDIVLQQGCGLMMFAHSSLLSLFLETFTCKGQELPQDLEGHCGNERSSKSEAGHRVSQKSVECV